MVIAPRVWGGHHLVYANALVEFIRKHTGDYFNIVVAAYPEIHPQAKSYDKDIYYLKKKLDAGANSAVTQFLFNVEAYFYFLDNCQAKGIKQPIRPGIMPIINFSNLQHFTSICGTEILRRIRQRIAGVGDDQESIRLFGTEVVTKLYTKLIEAGVPPIHFYTMNKIEPILTIAKNLGLYKPQS